MTPHSRTCYSFTGRTPSNVLLAASTQVALTGWAINTLVATDTEALRVSSAACLCVNVPHVPPLVSLTDTMCAAPLPSPPAYLQQPSLLIVGLSIMVIGLMAQVALMKVSSSFCLCYIGIARRCVP